MTSGIGNVMWSGAYIWLWPVRSVQNLSVKYYSQNTHRHVTFPVKRGLQIEYHGQWHSMTFNLFSIFCEFYKTYWSNSGATSLNSRLKRRLQILKTSYSEMFWKPRFNSLWFLRRMPPAKPVTSRRVTAPRWINGCLCIEQGRLSRARYIHLLICVLCVLPMCHLPVCCVLYVSAVLYSIHTQS